MAAAVTKDDVPSDSGQRAAGSGLLGQLTTDNGSRERMSSALPLAEAIRGGIAAATGDVDASRALVAAADEWMRSQGVKVPERLARMLTP